MTTDYDRTEQITLMLPKWVVKMAHKERGTGFDLQEFLTRVICEDMKRRRDMVERNTTCFECGHIADVKHHVIPRSLGGNSTVDLCQSCHSLAHGGQLSSISTQELTRNTLKKMKAAGKRTGPIPIGFQLAHDGVSLEPSVKEREAIVIIRKYRSHGGSLRLIARIMNERHSDLSRNGKWWFTQIAKALKTKEWEE